jgi:hypothetical protein
MKRIVLAAVLAAAFAPAVYGDHDIRLRGCVVPGLDKGTFALTRVSQVEPNEPFAIPPVADGRRVVFWLSDASKLRDYVGRMVEVRGKADDKAEESEIEIKSGPRDGGLIVEFEGPGKDVRVPGEAVADAIGTSGRADAGKDIKTFVVKVDVDDVDDVNGGQVCVK